MGFDYEWSVAEPGVSALEALAARTAQVVQSTISQGFSSLEKGDPPTARHFALINNMDGFFITGRDRDSDGDNDRDNNDDRDSDGDNDREDDDREDDDDRD
jgi:NitT/TauT family transport system substrate-binding protein